MYDSIGKTQGNLTEIPQYTCRHHLNKPINDNRRINDNMFHNDASTRNVILVYRFIHVRNYFDKTNLCLI